MSSPNKITPDEMTPAQEKEFEDQIRQGVGNPIEIREKMGILATESEAIDHSNTSGNQEGHPRPPINKRAYKPRTNQENAWRDKGESVARKPKFPYEDGR